MFFEFVDFLNEQMLFEIADQALAYVNDKTSERYLLTLAKIRVYQGRYLEGVGALDKLLTRDPKHYFAWV